MNSSQNQQTTGWYAPLEREQAPAPKTTKKRLSTPWRIGLGVFLALFLIVGSSLLFAGHGDAGIVTIPLPQQPQQLPETVDELPEDWHAFFNSYFVPPEQGSSNRLSRAEDVPDFTLSFAEPGEELSLPQLYERCAGSIVAITGYKDGKLGYFWGSGIVLSADGLILTNAHVIEDCDRAAVTLADDRVFEAMLVGADEASDIAVLKIDAQGLTPAEFGDSSLLRVGEGVAVIGNPISENYRLTMTDGIVSALSRSVTHAGRTATAIQTTAPINEGSSGGALLNLYGQVVGVTNMKLVSRVLGSSVEGMTLAVPSETVLSVVNDLIRNGSMRGKPVLGITVGEIPTEAALHYDIPVGLYVTLVSEGSDAERRGIRAGDIITDVNGIPALSNDVVSEAKRELAVGDTIRFTIWRDGESFDVDVALVDYYDVYGQGTP